ncbi:MAG TPA: hypothetical protein VJV77_01890 [Casimicrobiaceae bacterium]|nr:hypothetical protein [Casimicrobiaceae bacterium]
MTFPRNHDPRYFSLDGFRFILTRAQAIGYRIVPFRAFEPPGDRPVLLLRHDLDGPLGGAEAIAELESEAGVSATFFVQTAGDFYNLLSAAGRTLLRRLTELGHEVGLHYEAKRYLTEGDAALANDLRLLEDLCGQPVQSASQHVPIDDDAIAIERYVDNDAYAPRFTQPPMRYLSDSLMAWREATPHDLLDCRASFQLLTHPETWIGGYRDMAQALRGMMDEEIAAVRKRYRDVQANYEMLIAARAERDRQFRERRTRPPTEIASRDARSA